MMDRRALLIVGTMLFIAGVLLFGCSGSHGPTLPSPDGPSGGDVIDATDFIVEAGEVERFARNTTINVTGIVRIDGEVIAADGAAGGNNGTSIFIEAEGDITVTGLIKAGDGANGAAGGNGANGGQGGTISLTSLAGDITIGTAPDADAVAAMTSTRRGLHAGNGGSGGQGLLGGAGGKGGSVVLACASGTLTINEAPDLFHVGNGGHGGQGVVLGDDHAGFEIPEDGLQLPAHGGNSGYMLLDAQQTQGVETEQATSADGRDLLVVYLTDGVADGGVGGDGGDFFFGVDPETGEPSSPAQVARLSRSRTAAVSTASEPEVRGPNGGNGWPDGGRGGSAHASGRDSEFLKDRSARANGGHGGDATWDPDAAEQHGMIVVFRTEMRGGHGGEARAFGHRGRQGVACGPGQMGGDARARGGEGGDVIGFGPHRAAFKPGNGGRARAVSGFGGRGGDCCGTPPGRGGNGGPGGSATAFGGNGGSAVISVGVIRGRGGDAESMGGNGGDGGNGNPPGFGGVTLDVVANRGDGSPMGSATEKRGSQGSDGQACGGDPQPPVSGFGVVTSDSPGKRICGFPGFYKLAPGTLQLAPGFTIGGTTHPVVAWIGQSMIFSSDNSRLWVGSELRGMCLYRNPLVNHGDRAPDLELHIAGKQWFSIWYEEQLDTLYATTMADGVIYAWDSASAGSANRAPDRTIEVPGYHGQGYLIGAPGSGTLFMAARVHSIERFLVFLDARQLDGLNAADRYFEPAGFLSRNAHALSWDSGRDLLYVGEPVNHQIHVYANASGLSGAVTPDRIITIAPAIVGPGTGNWISGVVVRPLEDLLFVSMFGGPVLIYEPASTVQGTPNPVTSQLVGHRPLGMGVFKQ